VENLSYAIVQSLHNLGAVGVVAAPAMVLLLLRLKVVCDLKPMIYIAIASAVMQLLSGVGFAFISQFFLGQIPQVDGIAFGALVIKVTGVVLSVCIYSTMLMSKKPKLRTSGRAWVVLLIFSFIPLIGAAFLRWYG